MCGAAGVHRRKGKGAPPPTGQWVAPSPKHPSQPIRIIAMASETAVPVRLRVSLSDLHNWLPPTALPSRSPLVLVNAAVTNTLSFRVPLAPVRYRQLRELLDVSNLIKISQLFIILLLHYAHHPEDTVAHRSFIALILHMARAQDERRNSLLDGKSLEFAQWTPATGPPWAHADRLSQPWQVPFPQCPELILLKAGCASMTKDRPFSDDRAAAASAQVLASLVRDISRTPLFHRRAAQNAYRAWVSYPDLLLRGLRSPTELDEGHCIVMLHCIACAVATIGMENHYGLAPGLLENGVRLIKRDLPAVLDAIALHPEWSLFSLTHRLADDVEEWLPGAITVGRPTSGAIACGGPDWLSGAIEASRPDTLCPNAC